MPKPKPKPKGHRAAKRSAEEHADSPSSRCSKRRAAGCLPIPAETAVALSQEEQFKLRNAVEFDECNTEADSKEVGVKDEPTDTPSHLANGTQPLATRLIATITVPRNVRSSFATSSDAVPGAASTDANDRDTVLDTLLSQAFNPEMTQYVVRQILQDAQDSAGRGNEFGIAYVEAQIERLQRKGTPLSRLAEVIQLFQRGLRDLSNNFRSRISSIGGQAVRPESSEQKGAPSLGDELRRKHHVRQRHSKIPERESTRLQASLVEVASGSQGNLAAFEATHGQSDNSTTSSEEEGETPSKKISKYLDDDNEEYQVDGVDGLDGHSQCSGDTSTCDDQIPHDQLPSLTDLLLSHSSSECWQPQAVWHSTAKDWL